MKRYVALALALIFVAAIGAGGMQRLSPQARPEKSIAPYPSSDPRFQAVVQKVNAERAVLDEEIAQLKAKLRDLDVTRDKLLQSQQALGQQQQAELKAMADKMGSRRGGGPRPGTEAVGLERKLDLILERLESMDKRLAELEKKR